VKESPEVTRGPSPNVPEVPHTPFRPLDHLDDPVMDGEWEPRGEEPGTAFPVPWRWWAAVVVFLGAFALTIVFGGALVVLLDGAVATPALITLGTAANVIVAPLYVRFRYPGQLLRLFGPVRPHLWDALRGIGAGAGAFVVANVGLGSLITFVVERSGNELPPVQEELQQALVDSSLRPLVIVSVIALAPLGEELLFRGLLFQGLRRSLPLWPAMGISGLLFGLSHAEPLAIVILFPVGMYFAWEFHRRGTLITPIFAHATFNFVTFALLQLDVSGL
jgi:uncharacterized protein